MFPKHHFLLLPLLVASGFASTSFHFEGDGSPSMAVEKTSRVGEAPAPFVLTKDAFGEGLIGKAFVSDGNAVFQANAPTLSLLNEAAESTITFLLRPTGKRGYQVIMGQATVAPDNRIWWIGYDPQWKRFDFLVRDGNNEGQSHVFSQSIGSGNEWVLIAAIKTKNRIRIAGAPLSAEHPNTLIPSVEYRGVHSIRVPLTLGGRLNEPEKNRFKGSIDELTFWPRALSLTEIDALLQRYREGLPNDRTFDLAAAAAHSGIVEESAPVFPLSKASVYKQSDVRLNGAKENESAFILPMQLANGDFEAEFDITSADLAKARFQIDIGADGFLFDGPKNELRSVGNLGITTFNDRPLNSALSKSSSSLKSLRARFVMKSGNLAVYLANEKIWESPLGRDTYGEVAITALAGKFTIRKLHIQGVFLERTYANVFAAGEAGISIYRIPAITKANDGTLLAFAEARKDGPQDLGHINLVLRRSLDKGASWLPIQTLSRGGGKDPLMAVNPSPLLEPDTGRIHLFFHKVAKSQWGTGNYKVLHIFSDDNGANWSDPIDLQPQLPKKWLNFQPGPGHGIVLQHSTFAGRLLVPGWFVYRAEDGSLRYGSSLIRSDDKGKTWRAGGIGMDSADECMVAEEASGNVIMAIRPPAGISNSESRHFAISHDGGGSFDPFFIDKTLRATVCQSSILSTSRAGRLFFLYPGSGNYAPDASVRRAGLTLRERLPNGTWSTPWLIYAGRSGYSDMVELSDGSIGILFEGGRSSETGSIQFTKIFPTASQKASNIPALWHTDAGWGKGANKELTKVTGLDLDKGGHLFVAGGKENAVVEWNKYGEKVNEWGSFIKNKHGLRIFNGKVYVTDIGNHVVYECALNGKILRTFGTVGLSGEDTTHFNQPTDIAVAGNGDIYVSDGYGNSRIVCLSANGKFKFAWGRPGNGPSEFKYPHNIVIHKDRVYVADRGNYRIQIFDLDGKFIKQWTHVGQPYGLFLAANECLYVSTVVSETQHSVLTLTLDGEIMDSFAKRGKSAEDLDIPHSLTVSSDLRHIFVGEVENTRVHRFSANKATQ